MENNENIIPVSEVKDCFKVCRFCGKTIENDMMFCTFCGKNQKEEAAFKKQKKTIRKLKAKRVNATKAFSLIAFLFSLIAMIFAVTRMFMFGTPTISIFGSSNDTLIINQTVVIGSLLISMIFLKFGIFLFKL